MQPEPSPDKKFERAKLILHYAAETRKFEIEHFWKRSVYFWGLVAAAMIAYANLDEPDDQYARTMIICFGLITSVAWSLQNRGSKYWQEAWEQKVNRSQKDALGVDLFEETEHQLPLEKDRKWKDFWLRSRRYSVSKLAIAMSDLSVLLWVILGLLDAFHGTSNEPDCPKIGLYAGSFVFALAIICCGKSSK